MRCAVRHESRGFFAGQPHGKKGIFFRPAQSKNGARGSSRQGRPMASNKRDLFVGIDLGGTDIKATVTTLEGEILVKEFAKVLSLASEGPRVTIAQMKQAAE